MTKGLQGVQIFVGNGYTFTRRITWTRQPDDATDYTDAAVEIDFYASTSATAPALNLSTAGIGFNRLTNTADSQILDMTLSAANLTTLLGGLSERKIGYIFSITPTGGSKITRAKGNGYDGVITVCAPALSARQVF